MHRRASSESGALSNADSQREWSYLSPRRLTQQAAKIRGRAHDMHALNPCAFKPVARLKLLFSSRPAPIHSRRGELRRGLPGGGAVVRAPALRLVALLETSLGAVGVGAGGPACALPARWAARLTARCGRRAT